MNVIIGLSLGGILSGRLYTFINQNGSKMKYIYPESPIDANAYASYMFATCYILFNQLIPLGLLLTIEIVKLAYSRKMENDIALSNYD